MDNSKLFATFSLKSCDIGNKGDGIINTTHSQMTWTNIDLAAITGVMWDKYDYFTITLTNFINSGLTSTPFDVVGSTGNYTYYHENSSAVINLQGLPFVNSSYNYITRRTDSKAAIGAFRFNGDASSTLIQNTYMNAVIFAKTSANVNLTISLNRVVDGKLLDITGEAGCYIQLNDLLVVSNTILPDQCYMFRIDGIPNV